MSVFWAGCRPGMVRVGGSCTAVVYSTLGCSCYQIVGVIGKKLVLNDTEMGVELVEMGVVVFQVTCLSAKGNALS